ncbi:MAG: chitobiase/beta-hexosaminidase C-terminal domain-containing protein, partial [Polyangiaceae bacterium]|nr:chitobiase/beta-hexosaminidase C-terminal domain-containing protein [Polyangiaceae bacterium]
MKNWAVAIGGAVLVSGCSSGADGGAIGGITLGNQGPTDASVADATRGDGSGPGTARGDSGCFAVPALTQVRFFPRPGEASRMVGGKIVGSNVSPTDGFVDIATIDSAPPDGAWTALPLPSPPPYRFVKYYGPAGSFGDVAELELDSASGPVTGSVFGTPSSDGVTHVPADAFDGDPSTYYEGGVPNDQYVGLDLASGHVTAAPTFTPPGGQFTQPTQVAIATTTPNATVRYTTDGSDPSNGTVYDVPLDIEATTTVRAVASAPCMVSSADAESFFSVGAPAKTAQSSFHMGNSLTGPIIYELPTVVGLQNTYSLDFHNCVTSGVDLSAFWVDDPPPGCYALGVNPLAAPPSGGIADPKAALADPTLLPSIDNLVVQPYAGTTCTPYSDATHTGDGAYAYDFYNLAKTANNPNVQL